MSDDVGYPGQDFRGSRAGRYGMGQIRPQRRGLSPDSQRLLMFFGGVVAVVAALAGIATFTGRHHDGVPVIAADPRPFREKPADPGGLKIDASESDVFSGDSDTANSTLAPAAETPDPSAFRSAEAPPPDAPVARTNSTPATPIVAPVASPPMPSATATAPVQPASQPPAKTAVAPESQTLAQPASAKPAVFAAAKPAAPKPAPAAQSAGSSVETAHKTMIQLAAVGSEDAAKAEWQSLIHRFPELARHQPAFSRTEHDGKTFWRVRATGFADTAQARAFCEQVRGKGGGCTVADF